jgi:hypothetical protein
MRLRVGRRAVKLLRMRPRRAGWKATALAVALLLGVARAQDDGRVIRYENDALTFKLAKVQVADVLAELSRVSGAEIRGQANSREVSAEFEAVPLSDALHRLLGDQNFALVYGDGGKLKAVKLLGGPQAPPAPGTATAGVRAGVTTPSPSGDPGMVLRLFASQAPVPVTGRLAQTLGSDTATFQQLMDAGMHNEDAGIRAEAVRAGLQGIERDANLRNAVLNTVNSLDDAQLGEMIRGMAGERAEEFMMHVATQSRASELRIKASSILQQIRNAGRAGG